MEAAPPRVTTGPVTRGEWALVGGLFLTAFLAVLFTANAYGPTYDEPFYASAGVRHADWWARALRLDFGALRADSITQAWGPNHEHPPLEKVASGFSQRWFGSVLPGLAAFRLPSALWFAMTIAALYLFSRRAWGRRGGLFAALAFAFMPRVVAHAHLAALDMPIAAWFFVTAALTAVALARDSWAWTVLAGLAFGLALLSKMNAFFLPALLLPWGLIYHRRRWPKLLAATLAIGPAVFWLGWPWMWVSPLAHAREYLAFHLGHAAYNVWYLGRLYQYAPWHYPFVMTAVATPVAALALGLLGAIRSWPRRGLDPDRVLLLAGFVVAIAPSALPGTPKYNGVRLFLPAFPFLAALAGGGFAWLEGLVSHRLAGQPSARRTSVLAAVALGALLLYPGAVGTVASHPYQLAYYNVLVGGTAGAAKHGFETIYWGQVYKEAPIFLNAVPEANPRVLIIPKGCIYLLEFQQQAGALRRDIRFTGDEGEARSADYVMFQCMQSDYTDLAWELVKGARPAFSIRSRGAPLLVAYRRDAVAAALDRLHR